MRAIKLGCGLLAYISVVSGLNPDCLRAGECLEGITIGDTLTER